MEELKDGIYVLDIRTEHIEGLVIKNGWPFVTILPDGRQAIITHKKDTIQLVDGMTEPYKG
jgi:hypothetical protein